MWDFIISCDFACRADFHSFNLHFSNCFWYLTLNIIWSVWDWLFLLSAKFLMCWLLHDSDLAVDASETFARCWTHIFVDMMIALDCADLVLSYHSFISCVRVCSSTVYFSVDSHAVIAFFFHTCQSFWMKSSDIWWRWCFTDAESRRHDNFNDHIIFCFMKISFSHFSMYSSFNILFCRYYK